MVSMLISTGSISPTTLEQRLDKRHYQMFFVWFSSNMNILALSTGSAGPAFFNLGLRDSLVIILVVDIVSCAVPAFLFVVQTLLTAQTLIPLFLVRYSGRNWEPEEWCKRASLGGIVIIGVLSLVVRPPVTDYLLGYESVAWVPNVIAFVVMLGVGGRHLRVSDYPTYPPPSASTVISYMTFIASSVVSWCTMTPDYGVHHSAKASSTRIFAYTYLGFFCSSITGHSLGAAFAAMAPAVPSWSAGFNHGENIGGLISAVLSPAGGFGKFLVVLIALSIPSACAPTMYTFGTSFMTIVPVFARVPRYVFAIISEAICYHRREAFLWDTRQHSQYAPDPPIRSIIGYWSSAFAAIVITEHLVFRRRNFEHYNTEDWDKPKKLPSGIAAVLAFVGAIGIIVPCMSQVWYVGPIARVTGDIGMLTGFVVAGGLYLLLRFLELKSVPGHNKY
ncbi:hypothetical protein DXG01_004630 [Tephrocybe rancida]|nr:hypothetical protein DXG01_004630 [Tephrocybe rancida]